MNESTKRILVYAALLILILCGVFIRIYGLSEWAFTPDDVMHLSYGATSTGGATFKAALAHNIHSPGFFIILHYMEKISHNEFFLRCISLVPGIALIPSFYALGNIYKGRAAGLFMAFIATFSVELIVVSEVIRQYSLLLVLESWALYALLRYDKTEKFRYLIGYGLLSFMALHVHYTSAIFTMVCGIVWFFTLAFKEGKKRDMAWWVLIHIGLLAMLLIVVILKYQNNSIQVDMKVILNEYTQRGFSTKSDVVIANIMSLIFLNHHPFNREISLLFLVPLTIVGYALLIQKKEYRIIGLIVGAFTINIILLLVKLYPLEGEGRHCLYLVPLLLLPPASAVQYGIHYFNEYSKHHPISKIKKEWLISLPIVCFIGFICYGVVYDNEKSYFRYDTDNFVMTKQNYNEVMHYFFNSTKKGDIVITERCFVDYIFWENQSRSDDKIIGNIHHLTYKGRELYYTDSTSSDLRFWHMWELQDFLQLLSRTVTKIQQQPLWFFSAGWPSIFNSLLKLGGYHNPTQRYTKQDIIMEKLAREFVHSDEVSHRFREGRLGIGTGFLTNWYFINKVLLNKDVVEVLHKK